MANVPSQTVVTSAARARDCAKQPVWVLGTGEAVSHTTMSEWEDFTESPAVRSGWFVSDSSDYHADATSAQLTDVVPAIIAIA